MLVRGALKEIECKQKRQEQGEKEQLKEQLAHVATKEETQAFLDLSKKEQTRLLDAALRVHNNTGHRPPAALAKLLREKNAPLASRAAMEQVKCSSCIERGLPNPSPVANLTTSTTPFHTLGIDKRSGAQGQEV